MQSPRQLLFKLIGGAILGKCLGLVREILSAAFLGATTLADSFRAAGTAVTLPLTSTTGELLTATLIPLHRRWQVEGRRPELSAAICGAISVFASVLALAVFVFADAWVHFLTPGFGHEAHKTAVKFVRIMSLAMPGFALTSGLSCIEIAIGRTRISTWQSATFNVASICGLITFGLTAHASAIAWSFVLAFNLLACLGVCLLWHEHELAPSGVLSLDVSARAIAEFFCQARPLLCLPIVIQAALAVERILASAVAVGAVASIDYARMLTETATYLFTTPFGLLVLAGRRFEDTSRIADDFDRLISIVLGAGLPVSIFLAVFAPDIVLLVLQRGAFDQKATLMTAAAMTGFSFGLAPKVLGWTLVRILNAHSRNSAAMVAIAAGFAVNIAVSLATVPQLGVIAIGLSEAARDVTILILAMSMFACARRGAKAVLRFLPFAAVLVGSAIGARVIFSMPLSRLIIGALVLAAVGVGYGLLDYERLTPKCLRPLPQRVGDCHALGEEK